MTKHIYIIAGEKSGDIIGQNIISRLKELDPTLVFSGIGGEAMQSVGLHSLFDYNDLAVMGVTDVLHGYGRIKKHIKSTVNDIRDKKPDMVITIDAQGFSKRIAKAIADLDTKKIHIVAPTVWAWRAGRVHTYKKIFDSLFCLFPFEPQYFTDVGMDAHFVGHPCVENADCGDTKAFLKRHGIDANAVKIGLLAGSRIGEVSNVLKTYITVCEMLQKEGRLVHVIVPAVPAVKVYMQEALEGSKLEYSLVGQDEKLDAFKSCDIALATSGTVTLELAVAGVPMVVGYKTSFLTYNIIRHFVKIKYFSLPNILLGNKNVVPEFLQVNCTVDNLYNALVKVLDEDQDAQKNAFTQIQKSLKASPQGMGMYSAKKILSILKK